MLIVLKPVVFYVHPCDQEIWNYSDADFNVPGFLHSLVPMTEFLNYQKQLHENNISFMFWSVCVLQLHLSWCLCKKLLFSPQAWSSIVYELIPNVKELEQNLRDFANIIEADEVLLFERATFLVISHYCIRQHRDVNRFEKVSNIIKQFKLSCRSVESLSN